MLKRINGHPVSLPPTRYVIARSQDDYDLCNQYLKGTQFDGATLTFPTIIAVINNKVEGIIGTYPSKEAIICGPLLIKNKGLVKGPLSLKLVDAYESLLINMGVKVYVFAVDKADTDRVNMLKEIGLKPYARDNDSLWYMRKFYEQA